MNSHQKSTGYVYDPIFLKHTWPGHPESAQRLQAIMPELESSGLLPLLEKIPARAATIEELSTVHPVSHIRRIEEICRAGGGHLDPDTYTNRDTYEAAIVAAGGLIELTLAVLDEQLRNGYALVRPPGHHALPSRAMGFCIFNNVAIAARAAQQQRQLERVAIVDFDVHHGNGTQAVFEDDPTVLYISTHQYPHYPGTGRVNEIGHGSGTGSIVNFPLSAGVGDTGFRRIYTEVLAPLIRRFQPDLILVSAGYDGHWHDPLAGLGLSLTGMTWIAQTLRTLAEEVCGGRLVFTLEGGYDLDVLKLGVANSLRVLLGRDDMVDPLGLSPRHEPDVTELLAEVKRLHGLEE
ncbi:histone deacetylase [candidate division KSB3 bacterium]|uniref:Histone deacetylase n=1 Tax=candidate division KSB3 bacterium TaxID=2044937 RepID=A0A9D5JXU6_9BACT|nr:histone deacetylase [candidate division KSB3 bacterium]MBD3325822.1 histone deacetylase [candidate division KSB3 bacterium]